MTQPFCGDCTRARLSADGKLYTCLFAVRGHDLRGHVRSGATDGELADSIAGVWAKREDRYWSSVAPKPPISQRWKCRL